MTTTTTSTTLVPTRLGRLAVRGTGSGPTAVLWHSMFVDSRSWDRVTSTLGQERRLVLVDGPGWGGSDPLTHRTTMAECALAAEELLDALPGLGLADEGPVDWVGNAWGGHVGYRLAGTRPDRLRTLVAASAPTFPLPPARRRLLAVLSHVVQRAGVVGPLRSAVARAQLTAGTRATDPEAVDLLHRCLADADRRSTAGTLRSFVVGRTDLGDELRRSPVPVLLVAGDDRGDLSPEQARDSARSCTDARAVLVQGARTVIPLERPQEFAAAVLGFWREHPAGRAPFTAS
jgi:pimeloyl-ACP methyl ester carboxylesterase